MAMSDKTRKLLWGLSGSRCALCSRPLVVDPTSKDPAAIVGDECHIVSARQGGPRFDPTFAGDHDSEDNLILLCRVDHKRVDDQPEDYSAESLRLLKVNHVAKVQDTLKRNLLLPDDRNANDLDNFRTSVFFAPGQSEDLLEAYQQRLIRAKPLAAYGKIATGFGSVGPRRTHAWVQSFIPVSEVLLRGLGTDAGVAIERVTHERLQRIFSGTIPDWPA
ncbi:MAG: hypothetical protein SFV24_16915 [Gemmatimonadales bacterium]|nr:hypothetical protein [Gemmatimonadales bacterium]